MGGCINPLTTALGWAVWRYVTYCDVGLQALWIKGFIYQHDLTTKLVVERLNKDKLYEYVPETSRSI